MANTGVRAVRGLAKVPSDLLARELDRRRKVASQLEAKRTNLLGELASLEREIRECGGSLTGHGGGNPPAGRIRPKNELSLTEALAGLLKGKTMSVTDAAQAVQKAGYKTNSNNFRVQVNIALIKGGFKRVGRGLYTAQ